jgi:competence protein ComEA
LEAEAPKGDAVKWFLYITGSVRKPGVYQLSPGARLFHLVEAAGGLNNFADPVAFNLAAPLEDGMHVHIPKKGERKGERAILLDIPLYPGTVPSGPRSEFRESSGSLREKRNAEERNASAPIDVNRATEEELIALKGIGPVLAKNIVEYRRKNGRFKSVEDLLRVKGIGPKKLEGFRGSVVARP